MAGDTRHQADQRLWDRMGTEDDRKTYVADLAKEIGPGEANHVANNHALTDQDKEMQKIREFANKYTEAAMATLDAYENSRMASIETLEKIHSDKNRV